MNPENTRIGFVGIGVMGKSMCRNLMKHGYKATIYNRSTEKCNELAAEGAVVAKTPKEVAENSDIVFSIVGFPYDVREVCLGENGILAGLHEGGIMVDMTTSQPSLAVEIYEAAKKKDIFSLDAPVSGGDVGARDAKLAIMVGGDREVFDRVTPLFECMGTNIRYMGIAGCGQHTKMCNQILIATNMIGVCESLLYGYKAGLNLDEVIAAVGTGAAGSWNINNLGPRMVKRNFDPGFFVEHFIKDMGIALDEAKRMNLSLPGLALAHQLYMAVKAQGNEKLGTQSLLLAFEQMNGLKEGISSQKQYYVCSIHFSKLLFDFIFQMSNTAIRRIHADIRELKRENNPMLRANPLEDNLFEWHFTIHGTPNSDYDGGIYHGRILLPPEWPMKPPQIIFTTVNGRFEVNTPICLSFTSFHPEEWQASWGIRTILEAIISFFPVESSGAVGSITCSSALRKQFAKESRHFICPKCGPIVDLIPPLTNELIQSYYTSPVSTKEEEEAPKAAPPQEQATEEVKEEEKEIEEKEEEEVEEEVEVIEENDVRIIEEKTDMDGVEENSFSPTSAVSPSEIVDEFPLHPSGESPSAKTILIDGKEVKVSDILLRSRYTRPLDASDRIRQPSPSAMGASNEPPFVAASTDDFLKSMGDGSMPSDEELRKRLNLPQNVFQGATLVPVFVPVVVPVIQNNQKDVKPNNQGTWAKVFSIIISILIIMTYIAIFLLQLYG